MPERNGATARRWDLGRLGLDGDERVVGLGCGRGAVLPGGRLRIADFRNAARYAEVLAALGAADVAIRRQGPPFWYGGPWFGTSMASPVKPR